MEKQDTIVLSLVKDDRGKGQKVWTTNIDRVMDKIIKDADDDAIANFRLEVRNGVANYSAVDNGRYRLYASVRMGKDNNGVMGITGHTGVLVLNTVQVADTKILEQLKMATIMMPSTIAAFNSLSGNQIVILVRVCLPNRETLDDESARDLFYTKAYQEAADIYSGLLHIDVVPAGIKDGSSPMMAWCHMSGDKKPIIADSPTPMKIVMDSTIAEMPRRNRIQDEDNETSRLVSFLDERFELRFNRVKRTTEYLDKLRPHLGWRAADLRFINGVAIDASQAGIKARPKDVSIYLNSSKIKISDPTEELLYNLQKWDGHDHIGDMADRVKTSLPQWKKWFRMWFLGLVAQWMGYNSRFGNSIVPLLISPQGYRKSTFCRQLLPPQLRWGYLDNLKFTDQKQVMTAMTDQLLINLDEFNSISKKTQEGFLKNTIQLAEIAIKRPYARHIEQERRRASFIATSNMTDVLSDPSGSRRFFAVEVTEPIDTDTKINYEQLYAQAVEAVRNGERRWFDQKDIDEVMAHNRKYAMLSSADMYFNDYFETADANDEDAKRLTATEIYDYIRKRAGASAVNESVRAFGRYLSNLTEITKVHTRRGTVYIVKERKKDYGGQ
ncbi:MAG: VapE family protein [Prevotella sp.]|nr:VapE family protein [Prevotellaceae bacterium]MDY5250301.1 VapE family protein [Prevotella sp.]